jgi:hypothetical protein
MSTNQEYFCIAAEGEITFGRMVVVISRLHSSTREIRVTALEAGKLLLSPLL